MERYTGERIGDVRHGEGEYVYDGGLFSYSGGWVDGVKHSEKARFVIQGVSVYEGEFRNGEMEGQGIRRWEDGRVYVGQFHEGEMHGKGVWTHPNGEKYEGEFVCNRRHGQGKLTTPQLTYSGGFKQHRFHGPGVLIHSSRDFMRGYFEDNTLSGNGDGWEETVGRYIGEWKAGKPHGHGRLLGTAAGCEVIGEFADGECVNSARFIEARVVPSEGEQPAQPQTARTNQKGNKGGGNGGSNGAKQAQGKAATTKGKDKKDVQPALLLPVHQHTKGAPLRIELQLLQKLAEKKTRPVLKETGEEELETYEEPAVPASDKLRKLELFACKVPDDLASSHLHAPPDRLDAVPDLETFVAQLSASAERVSVYLPARSGGELTEDTCRFWTCRLWPELTIAQFNRSKCALDPGRVLKCGDVEVIELEDDRGVKCVKHSSSSNREPITASLELMELPDYVSPTMQQFGLHVVLDFRLLPPHHDDGDAVANQDEDPEEKHEDPKQETKTNNNEVVDEHEHAAPTTLAAEAVHDVQLLSFATSAGHELKLMARYTNDDSLAAQITTIQATIGENTLSWVVGTPTHAYEWASVGVVIAQGVVDVFLNGEKLQPVRIRNSAMERWKRSVKELETTLLTQGAAQMALGSDFEAHFKGPAIFW